MSFNIIAFGERVKYYRKKRGYSQNHLSELIDKTPPYISLIENGERSISLDTLIDLVNALEITADELLKDSLDNSAKGLQNEFADLLSDCREHEVVVLLDVLTVTKEALRSREKR